MNYLILYQTHQHQIQYYQSVETWGMKLIFQVHHRKLVENNTHSKNRSQPKTIEKHRVTKIIHVTDLYIDNIDYLWKKTFTETFWFILYAEPWNDWGFAFVTFEHWASIITWKESFIYYLPTRKSSLLKMSSRVKLLVLVSISWSCLVHKISLK